MHHTMMVFPSSMWLAFERVSFLLTKCRQVVARLMKPDYERLHRKLYQLKVFTWPASVLTMLVSEWLWTGPRCKSIGLVWIT